MSRDDVDYAAENRALRARIAELEKRCDETDAALEQRLHLFEEMLETVPVGVVVADAKGEILFGNSALEAMVGHATRRSKDTDSYGEWVSYHADGTRVESQEYPLARVYDEGTDEAELEAHYERPDGSRFWMRIIGKAIRDDAGKQVGAAVAVIDIDAEHHAREAQDIMIAELNHRVKNAFSVTQAITSRTLRSAEIPLETRQELDKRLQSYADAHSRLVGSDWTHSPLRQVAVDVVTPIAGDRLDISGEDLKIDSRTALSLSMAFYELASNAIKYGSLTDDSGKVDLSWRIEEQGGEDVLVVEWRERGGAVPVNSGHQGFGTFILTRAVSGETGGKVETDYPESGFIWRVTMPCAGNVDA